MKNTSLEILEAINSWKHKRAHPYKMEWLKKIIEENVNNNLPVPLFGYWGIGSKDKCGSPEANTICYLNLLAERVREIYAPGLKITFILSDVHALNNCIPEDTIQSYIDSTKNLFAENNIESVLLSDLYKKYNLSPEAVIESINGNNKLWWQFFSLRKELIKQANNVSMCEDKNLCAKRYAIIRKDESKLLGKEYSNQIFMTYSPPHYRILYPDLPTVYLYSEKKGSCVVPWFNNAE